MIIFFDAVGTLIFPSPSAVDVYHRAGGAFGSSLSREAISNRFRVLFAAHFGGKKLLEPTSESDQKRHWSELVQELYEDISSSDAIFEHLWNHFAQASSWQLYPDVEPTLRTISRHGIRFGIASNFDRRLHLICRYLPALQSANWIFTSADIGWSKPNPKFFAAIEAKLNSDKSELWMVGDNAQTDFQGALDAGWKAIQIVRRDVKPKVLGRINVLTGLLRSLLESYD